VALHRVDMVGIFHIYRPQFAFGFLGILRIWPQHGARVLFFVEPLMIYFIYNRWTTTTMLINEDSATKIEYQFRSIISCTSSKSKLSLSVGLTAWAHNVIAHSPKQVYKVE
jgi:hypothetical protein